MTETKPLLTSNDCQKCIAELGFEPLKEECWDCLKSAIIKRKEEKGRLLASKGGDLKC